MRILVVGGTGTIGREVVKALGERGHQVDVASRSTGVDVTVLDDVKAVVPGHEVVVDASNAPSFDAEASARFFETVTRHLLEAEPPRVRHHIVVSIVGADRVDQGYLHGKVAQELAVRAGTVPYTIVRATQVYEFLPAIIDASSSGQHVVLTDALIQPIAARDLGIAIAAVVDAPAADGVIEVAGPHRIPLDEAARVVLAARPDGRTVTTDPSVGYLGMQVGHRSLIPAGDAELGMTSLASWLL